MVQGLKSICRKLKDPHPYYATANRVLSEKFVQYPEKFWIQETPQWPSSFLKWTSSSSKIFAMADPRSFPKKIGKLPGKSFKFILQNNQKVKTLTDKINTTILDAETTVINLKPTFFEF